MKLCAACNGNGGHRLPFGVAECRACNGDGWALDARATAAETELASLRASLSELTELAKRAPINARVETYERSECFARWMPHEGGTAFYAKAREVAMGFQRADGKSEAQVSSANALGSTSRDYLWHIKTDEKSPPKQRVSDRALAHILHSYEITTDGASGNDEFSVALDLRDLRAHSMARAIEVVEGLVNPPGYRDENLERGRVGGLEQALFALRAEQGKARP